MSDDKTFKDIDSGKLKQDIEWDQKMSLKEHTKNFMKWFWISFGIIIGIYLFIIAAGFVYAWLRKG